MATIRTKSCLADVIALPTNYKKRKSHRTLTKLLILSRTPASGQVQTPNQCRAPGPALDLGQVRIVGVGSAVVQAQIRCRSRKTRPQALHQA